MLDLFSNQLTMLPDSICKLRSLSTLSLNSNRLRSLPACIGHLHGLRVLLLNEAGPTSLPDEISKLSSLKHLDVSSNKLAPVSKSFKVWLKESKAKGILKSYEII